jgi:hypothetical protein
MAALKPLRIRGLLISKEPETKVLVEPALKIRVLPSAALFRASSIF